MADPETFRDSTQIVLPAGVLGDLEGELVEQFAVSVFERGDVVRVIGSPVEIQAASDYLARHGVNVP